MYNFVSQFMTKIGQLAPAQSNSLWKKKKKRKIMSTNDYQSINLTVVVDQYS